MYHTKFFIFASQKNIMMKKVFIPLVALAFLASCAGNPEGAETTTSAKQEASVATGTSYAVDAATSNVGWQGTGVGHGHEGIFKLNSGTLSIANGNIAAGNFEINIASIDDTDIKDGSKKDLIGHLLGADFFDATKYPTAKFEVTKCEALTGDSTATHTISGNLTLKDSTTNVTFPAMVSVSETEVSAKAKFVIDRTKWGMSYGNDKSLKDKFISPEVGITLDIKAKK
jgi:polyisoprenoid-binding protein YceI